MVFLVTFPKVCKDYLSVQLIGLREKLQENPIEITGKSMVSKRWFNFQADFIIACAMAIFEHDQHVQRLHSVATVCHGAVTPIYGITTATLDTS